jgi:hypothetical protein
VDSSVTLGGHHAALKARGREHNKIMHLLGNFCWS